MSRIKLPEQLQAYNFTQLYKKEHHPRLKVRLLGLSYIQVGKTLQETAALLHVECHAVGEWIKRFSKEGLEGLTDKRPPGRRAKLTQAQEQALIEYVECAREAHTGGRLTAIKVQHWIAMQWNIAYKIPGIYTLFERLGLVWITARPCHAKADEALQEAFKKTS